MQKNIPNAVASIRHNCLFLKDMGWKHTAYHIKNSNPGQMRLKLLLNKNLKITFASQPKDALEKKKENNGNCNAFCVTRKCKIEPRNKVKARMSFQLLNLLSGTIKTIFLRNVGWEIPTWFMIVTQVMNVLLLGFRNVLESFCNNPQTGCIELYWIEMLDSWLKSTEDT